MHLIPGVHQQILPHLRDGGSDHHITCAAAVNESDAIPAILQAGGAILFNYGVPHCTKNSHHNDDCAGLALHYLVQH